MADWWTYRPQDFLLFSPRVYWRMFELHNEAVWPVQIAALLLGAAFLVWSVRPRQWSSRAASALLAAVWIWVAWSFLWIRYSMINWAAVYAVPAFALEALLLIWIGVLRDRLRVTRNRTVPGAVCLALVLYAVVLHPFVSKLAGRPFQAAEVFGVVPDPTAIATLGFVAMASGGPATWLLLVVPLAWCITSWATLFTMEAPEAWIPLTAAALAVASRLSFLTRERTARVS